MADHKGIDIVQALTSLLNTLNLVHVSGEEDLDRMLASIRLIRSMITSFTPKENNPKGGIE